MPIVIESSDQGLLEMLQQRGALGIAELAKEMQVTATAVRQRIQRLAGQGLIERQTTKAVRGRPSHRYSLSNKAIRRAGHNFADLTIALWQEIRTINDPEIRQGLMQRIATRMAGYYAPFVRGRNTTERMASIVKLFAERNVNFIVETEQKSQQQIVANDLLPIVNRPVLAAMACPYPQLAEQDRSICALENLMISELLNERVKLTDCRLDGSTCCRFETN